MRVEKHPHHETTGYDEGYDWVEYTFEIEGRRYRAEQRLGSGIEVFSSVDRKGADLAAVADYLMLQDGVRKVYHAGAQLRPERLHEPRPLRSEERELLDHLLAVDDSRVAALREQAEHVLVEDDSGLPFRLDLVVPDDTAPPATDLPRQQFAISATTFRDDEEAVTASLWLDGEYLSAIEIDWYVNEPRELPRPDELHAPTLS